MAKLNLSRPIAFFDLETTGINIVSDRIVEISILKIYSDEKKESKTYRINPTIPIPDSATKIHGIKDADVQNAPTFKQIAKEIADLFDNCDLAGYNINRFDIPLLMEEFLRAETEFDMNNRRTIDVQAIFHKKEERTLSAAYKFYCGKELTCAHNAEADAGATFEILESQLDRYPDLKNDVEYLQKYSSYSHKIDFTGNFVYDDKNILVFNFGKHRGKSVKDIFKAEPQYYDWMMKKNFALHSKKIITEIFDEIKKDNEKMTMKSP